MELFIFGLYNLLIVLIVLFSIGQLGLLVRYLYGRWRITRQKTNVVPNVTVLHP